MPLETIVDLLEHRTSQHPDRVAYRFLADGEVEAAKATYLQQSSAARSIATALMERKAQGERALLLFPPTLDFISAFLGCLYAGVIAVPLYPPRSDRSLPRLMSVATDAQPRFVLTTSSSLPRIKAWLSQMPGGNRIEVLATDQISPDPAGGWSRPAVAAESIAFLQYTSGSTSVPKGVIVSHGNLLHNEEMISRAFAQSDSSVIVSWLPLYHDMGLIGGVLQPLYLGAECILMSPLAFVQKPVRWLKAISSYRATTSGGPNFAYDLCVEKIRADESQSLDLSSWQLAFNGAEPVRAETLHRFAHRFADCGFRKESFYPCYGLAEATLFVAGGVTGTPPRIHAVEPDSLQYGNARSAAGDSARHLVGCGRPWAGQEVLIVNPEKKTACHPGEVGEIWVSGPSVARGYWNRPQETERDFGGSLSEGTRQGKSKSFLRTGDLGFLHQDELFVTGRIKDLIIVRGRNYYPHDLEATAQQAHSSLRAGCGAAFFMDAPEGERVVLVQEVESSPQAQDFPALTSAIRGAVSQEHELALHDVVLIKPGTIPKTSSGKIQRLACKAKYLKDELHILARDQAAPGNALEGFPVPESSAAEQPVPPQPGDRRKMLEQQITQLVAAAIRTAGNNLPADKPLVALGLDSLGAIELQHGLEQQWEVVLPLTHLLEDATITSVAAAVASKLGPTARSRIKPASVPPAAFPLSPGQKGLWFVQQLAPESSAYNISVAMRATGALDIAALQRALQGLMDRHPALRTSFHLGAGGDPVQRVHESIPAKLDFSEAEDWTEQAALSWLAEKAVAPFDLQCPPLLRVAVLRRSEHEHFILFVMHHICGDFWSFTIAFDELRQLYAKEVGAGGAELPKLELRYSDYVEHQRQQLEGSPGAELWEYWREALKPPLPEIDLPTDHPRPPVQTYRGGARSISLGSELTQKLHRLSRSCNTTLYTTLLTAFHVLLHRYTGEKDIVVGSPVAGRSCSELAGIIGYFTNPLVMRLPLPAGASFSEVLQLSRRMVAGALQHQDYPFPLLMEHLRPVRDPSRSPLFQSMFILQKAHRAELDALASFTLGDAESALPFGPLKLRSLRLPDLQVPFDLTLVMSEGQDTLQACLQYNRDLFDEVTADRLINGLVTILQAVSADPEQKIDFLPILSEQHTSELRQWNATQSPYTRNTLLHQLVESQAVHTPDAPAVEDGATALSYAELDHRANQLAHHLQALGVGPESIVGVYLERSVDIAVALLGILKAGGAYLPLDPAFPEERVTFMLGDSRAAVVLTQEALHQRLIRGGGNLLLLDRDWPEIAKHPPLKPPERCDPANLAYVIYTSGSTGRPKGVQISHRAVTNFLSSMGRSPGMEATDVLLSVTTISFDIFGLELYLPLICGAKVVFASREVAADGYALLELLKKTQATVMQATPATWRLLMTAAHGALPPMRALCGGDILPPELVKELLASGCSVWNLYGPTETTIWSCAHSALTAPVAAGTIIGRPIANTQVYVLDANLQPLPPGVPGELVIGGDGLARGYWQRPALTAERFIPNPFSDDPGERLYRTGDLARWRADATIEFFGRVDNQVKVRGYRIELGEVESALSSYPGVHQAVVIARNTGNGDKRLIAYLVPGGNAAPAPFATSALRHFLSQRLPDAFVPSHFVTLQQLPLTPNGKIDRKALPDPDRDDKARHANPNSALERSIAEIWKDVLGAQNIGVHDNFFELGGHSLLLAQVQTRLRDAGHAVSMVDLFRWPTIADLARHLGADTPSDSAVSTGHRVAQRRQAAEASRSRDIAIIGMAGRFPQATTVPEFWKNISSAKECISFFSEEDLQKQGVDRSTLEDPNYVKAGGVLEGEDLFDASFFGFNPREAELMDPQQRLFLECAWHALEDAGYDSERYCGRVGVFAGAGLNTYLHHAASALGQSSALRYQAFIGNDKDFIATRVSYKLNLKGPSVTVQTACSTSLVAVHFACQSLFNRECDMAMAGAVGVRLSQREGYLYETGGILSPDGHCRAFDKDAAGTVFGSGMGALVLKRLEDAISDGDNIHAVIKGSAINNDGSMKVGYTAPSVDGQAAVISEALAMAGIRPETVSYIETHGTGTSLGDPIEIEALSEVFKADTSKTGFCAIGSVKTNIGHLDTAAGIAGLIKTVCALKHSHLPPSLNFSQPNPKINFAASPFYVNTRLAVWERNGTPRRAGVSSFGIGGTNAHVVIEEAPTATKTEPSPRPWKVLTLSAATPSALDALTKDLAAQIEADPNSDLSDLAYSLQVGRRAFPCRRLVLCQAHDDTLTAIQTVDPERVHTGELKQQAPEIAFLFPGQGSQYVNMGKELYQQEPTFRREIDACAEILQPHLSLDIRNLLFPAEASEEAANQLEQTAVTQPALFAVEYALARLWAEWGVNPSAMLGHSIGEYVAACLAGVFSLGEALKVVALRGRLMQSVPPGAMLAVRLPESELADFLKPEIFIAAINSPGNCVVSGTLQAIAELETKFERKGVAFGRLHTSHAFHSGMMEPIVPALVEAMSGIGLHPPQIPYVSNLTGRWITPAEATDPQYWGEHLRQTVRFAEGIRELATEPNRVLLECGPGHTLSALARQQSSRTISIPCLPHAREQLTESFTIARALGKLWLYGTEINWNSFYAHERRRRVPLPLYPFERQRYWIKPDGTETRSRSMDDWLYVPCWRPAGLLQNGGRKIEPPILIFADETGFANRLAKRLRKEGNTVVTVSAGTAFAVGSDGNYSLNSSAKKDYRLLLENLARTGLVPRTVVHAWNVTVAANSSEFIWADARCRSFDSLIFLAEALETVAPGTEVRLCVLSNNMQKTGVEQVLHPEKATLLGPVRVIPQEYPNISCKSIDIVLPDFDGATEDLIDDLVIELATTENDLIAYRSGERWTRGFAQLHVAPEGGPARPLKQNGVYLITGGLGGVGLTFAETLASRVHARLILTGRSSFPEQSLWEEWISTHGDNDECSQVIRRLQSIEKLGAEVMVLSADVADRVAMESAVRRAEEHFGPIDGVVHAAGVPGGGLIQLKTGELADTVLKPKVQGTLVLHSIFRERRLDFFVLCSSINSIIGGFGQSDYAAANAFCDAFAQAQFQRRGCYTVSVNWDRWNEVGMTARRFSAEDLLLPRFFQNGSNDNEPDTGHALLGRLVTKFPDSLVNVADFGPDKQWVLSEHKIAGHPIVPGTTYLEMARAVFAQEVPATPLTIEKAVFPTPLIVHEGETRSVVTLLRQSGEKFLFRVLSKPKTNASSQSEWQEHASGEVALTNGATPGRTVHDVARLIQNFEGNRRATEKQFRESGNSKFIATGPRWDVLQAVYVGQAECLALLELPDKFAEDLDRYWLHPAVLDVATGFVHFLAQGDYLPLLYERITIWAPLARKVFSHVQLRSDLRKDNDVITSDISIFDANGAELVKIEGFSMKRVRESALAEWQQAPSPIKERTSIEQLATRGFGPGMSARQGAELFHRILTQATSPQVIVSARDLHHALREASAFDRNRLLSELERVKSELSTHARPEVSSEYTAPADELEQRIAAIWQTVLGIDRVGIYDNFFELGGTSLIGVELVAALKKELNLDIPTVSIFEAPTVAALAKYLRPGGDKSTFQQIQSRANRKKQALGMKQQMKAGAGRER